MPMIQRIVSCNVRPEKIDQFRGAIKENVVPRIKKQNGFVDVIESIDTSTGQFVCSTFWKTKDDVDRYDSGLFQEIASELTPFLQEVPTVQTLEVETSTPHNIAAGRSAAA
jgi:quinol monooxygenase YgiN